jgi:hypothetical protein
MKCSACGAENISTQLNCLFCGASLNNSTTRIETDLVNQDDKYSFFVKKIINGERKESLESNEIGLKFVKMNNGEYFLYFISFSLVDKSELFINLYAVTDRKSFTWDGECQSLELKIVYNNKETINFNVNYTSNKDDDQLSSIYGNFTRVYFRVPFTKELLLKMLESEEVVLNIKARSKHFEKIKLSSENLVTFCGYYNNVYNSTIRVDDVNKYWSDKMKINLVKKKGLLLIINKYSDLKGAFEQLNYVEFKEWINSNKEKLSSIVKEDENNRASEKQTKENKLQELKQLKEKLSKIEENSLLRVIMNIILSLVLLIYLWIKIDFKTTIIVVALYNILFAVWSKNRTSTLEKNIKDLEESVK